MDVNEKPVHSNAAAGSTNLPDTKIREKKKSLPQIFEKTFESFLWSSRLAVLVAVLASVAVGLGLFYIATVDLPLRAITSYLNVPAEKHEDVRTQIVTQVVEAIDGYLLATVMLIFAFGLYELFISRIDRIEKDDRARDLKIHSLDDLKHRLGQVVLLILVVKFFEGALAIKFNSLSDLLLLSMGILLITIVLNLTHKQPHRSE
jgi:uncharacterized membrane protein YqhA